MLALQVTGTGTDPASAELMLVNPHGDITATIPDTTDVPAAQISGVNDTDEYGNVENPPGPTPYGWVGAAQRSTADQAGIIQMGARQYNPGSGRFLTLDPVPGGNPNPYTYPLDPINGEDLTGEYSVGRHLIAACVIIGAARCARAVAISTFMERYAASHWAAPTDGNPDGVRYNQQNAGRHVMWTMLLSWSIGSARTNIWNRANELDAPNSTKADRKRDHRNNSVGLTLAEPLRALAGMFRGGPVNRNRVWLARRQFNAVARRGGVWCSRGPHRAIRCAF